MPPSPTRWHEAPEVKAVADRLIPLYHPHLDTYAAQIRYLFRTPPQHRAGKTVWGKAHLLTGLPAHLAQVGRSDAEPDLFLMEIALWIWLDITPAQQEALVDHELEHFKVDTQDDGAISKVLQPHDIEEFDATVARHGTWKPDLVRFAKALSAGPDASTASDALMNPADDEIGQMLEVARKSEHDAISDILRRARG
jgi:hypothetical protein